MKTLGAVALALVLQTPTLLDEYRALTGDGSDLAMITIIATYPDGAPAREFIRCEGWWFKHADEDHVTSGLAQPFRVDSRGAVIMNPHVTDEWIDCWAQENGFYGRVRVTFDPQRLSYEALLGYYFRMHDPTTLNRQENDVGTQYRSAIFYTSPEQKRVAEAVKASVDKSGKWKRPLVTQIVSAGKFWPAEAYHQDYLVHNPNGYNCHKLRD